MNILTTSIDFVLHIDKYVGLFIQNYGISTYLILFAIILLETGLVITPFLPGDSLIFVVGTFAAQEVMNILILFITLAAAAVIGDSVNYWIGNYFGDKVFARSRFFKKEHLEKTKKFYVKYGAKTIILARFIPIVRTFAPFVAGIGKMEYKKFFFYNMIGGVTWITIFLGAGYFLGTIPFVKENLTYLIFAIIIASFLPPIIEYIKRKRESLKP